MLRVAPLAKTAPHPNPLPRVRGRGSKNRKTMAQLTVEQAFQLAVRHHQAGRLAQAEPLYRQILSRQSNHADALHNLGLIAHQVGRNDAAADLIRRAIALKPGDPAAHFNLGVALQAKGNLDEAISAYRQAISLRPTYADAHSNLGVVLQARGQFDEAIVAYRAAITAKPADPEAHRNLGNAMQAKGELDEAIAAYRRAIALKPAYPQAHVNLGDALRDKGELDGAIAAYRQAIALEPGFSEAHNNLGSVLKDKGELDGAIAAYRRAIAANPSDPEAHSNLGNALRDKGKVDEAIAACRAAIALDPGYAEAHWNLALALLTHGDFSQGFDEFEWRWKWKIFPRRDFPQPLWNGEPLAGATLLLHAEQGFGDTLQFIRYLPLVEQRGGKVIIECQPELQRVLRTAAGGSVVARGQEIGAFDVHCPLLNLPRIFGTTPRTIPRQVPYLYADRAMVESWRSRLGGNSDSFKVGLAWAGNQAHMNDRSRSMMLSAFAPLGRLPGIRFYSLQKGGQADQAKNAPEGLELIDWTNDLDDFADTAAFIANLDLVISVDTSVAHLAGAMGKPVWVMLPFAADWRWMREHEDSPWYPTMRLFRQTSIGDWESVIQRVGKILNDLALLRGNSSGPKP